MKSYKWSKAEVYEVLTNVLRNAPAKIQRKKQVIQAKKKNKAKLKVIMTMKKT